MDSVNDDHFENQCTILKIFWRDLNEQVFGGGAAYYIDSIARGEAGNEGGDRATACPLLAFGQQ